MSIAIPQKMRGATRSLGTYLRSAGMSDPAIVPQRNHLVADDA